MRSERQRASRNLRSPGCPQEHDWGLAHYPAGGHPRPIAYAYLLLCSDGSYYAGSTHNLEHRVWQHNNSDTEGAAYTRQRRPVALAWSAEFENIGEAYAFEQQLQGWGRAKREALIRGDLDALIGLSKRRRS